jgi:hypothetical protein
VNSQLHGFLFPKETDGLKNKRLESLGLLVRWKATSPAIRVISGPPALDDFTMLAANCYGYKSK